MKEKRVIDKLCLLIMTGWVVLGILFYAIASEQLTRRTDVTDAITPTANVGEILAGDIVKQSVFVENDVLEQISLYFQTFARSNIGTVKIALLDGTNVLFETLLDASALLDNEYFTITPHLTDVSGKVITLRITSDTGTPGNAVTVAYGNSIHTIRGNIPIDYEQAVTKNEQKIAGTLCMRATSIKVLWFGQYYWHFFAVTSLLLAFYLMRMRRSYQQGKSSMGLRFISAMIRYGFLLRQLVMRDFKTRYKRSVLGVLWSFLNPLLTLLVQYVVFSTLFKSDIPNYPVYLLSGIVCFGYFNEAVNQSMMSIVGNAGLITKVYVPKYIYPLSKVISSGINLLLSLVPLVLVILITGAEIHKSILLLPLGLMYLFLFCLGLGMLLATAMVFFRDTQFLWGVASMLWMYATPIFYPETIIPEQFMPLYKMNPLYHIIRFFRTILIDGVAPEPKAFLLCLVACLVPLILGLFVFKKNQNKFILYV